MEEIKGITLKAARVNAGYEQKEAAHLLGISVVTLGSWESGKTHPNILQARSIAQLYNISLDCLIFLHEKSSKN